MTASFISAVIASLVPEPFLSIGEISSTFPWEKALQAQAGTDCHAISLLIVFGYGVATEEVLSRVKSFRSVTAMKFSSLCFGTLICGTTLRIPLPKTW